MLPENITRLLKDNWQDEITSLYGYCYVKFIDKYSDWSCYIYAINPRDEDEILCVLNVPYVECCKWSMRDLQHSYNECGEHPVIDHEFRRTPVQNVLKRLNGFYG